jgi:signal transduction histidine kinase
VLDNLLSNAVKFTPGGGRVRVQLTNEDGSARIAVSDTGIGIPASELGRLSERFFRTSNAAAHAIQGTGLGLAITKTMVEMHGGSLSVESEEGRGSTFAVTLPLAA